MVITATLSLYVARVFAFAVAAMVAALTFVVGLLFVKEMRGANIEG